MEYVYEFDNLNRQLDLLRGANQKLQDTNDGLREIVDVSGIRTPRRASSRIHRPDSLTFDAELESLKRKRHRRPGGGKGSNGSASEHGGYDSDSLRSRDSRSSLRSKVTDVNFGLKRFMDDLGKFSKDFGCILTYERQIQTAATPLCQETTFSTTSIRSWTMRPPTPSDSSTWWSLSTAVRCRPLDHDRGTGVQNKTET